jgi:hypothetical protein
VNLSIDASSSSFGDMLFFGFDTALSGLSTSGGTSATGDFTFNSSSNNEGISEVCSASTANGIRTCGGVGSAGNFNGPLGLTEGFGYIVRMGGAGLVGAGITAFDFSIATGDTLTASSFSRVGIRAQSVGASDSLEGQDGSTKDINNTGVFDAPSPVPLPAAGWMLIAGLGGLAAMGRRRKA